MIEAAIFDMDGVIIDSEPLWKEAQEEVFTSLGVNYDLKLSEQTVGIGSYDTIDFWFRLQPWSGKSYKEVELEILKRLSVLIDTKGRMITGIPEMIALFKSRNLKLAVASGSPKPIIEKVLSKFNILHQFDVVHTAEDETLGKPHPAVFLNTASKLGVDPRKCVVVEDSFYGLIASKAARMKAIAYLPDGSFTNERFAFADLKLASFTEFDISKMDYLNNLI